MQNWCDRFGTYAESAAALDMQDGPTRDFNNGFSNISQRWTVKCCQNHRKNKKKQIKTKSKMDWFTMFPCIF